MLATEARCGCKRAKQHHAGIRLLKTCCRARKGECGFDGMVILFYFYLSLSILFSGQGSSARCSVPASHAVFFMAFFKNCGRG